MRVNSLQWYHSPRIGYEGELIELDGDEWHHAHHVVRLKTGDRMILCNGTGTCMEAEIRSANAKAGTVLLTNNVSQQFHNPRNYKVSIGFAPTKNIDRTEFAVEKLVEIGVDEIFFLDCQHSERSHLRLDRMNKIAVAAAKQSKKSVFPLLHDLMSPKACLENINPDNQAQIFACHIDDNIPFLSKNYLSGESVLMLIGPEGGFSAKELESMSSQNVKFVHLGPFRLRAETAAIVACTVIHSINQT